MARKLTKRQIRKKATLLKRKEERKLKRSIKQLEKQKYNDFVKIVKERDNYTCQISKKYLKNAAPQALQVAHILSKENYPELKLDPMNTICLSFYYHKNAPISSHLDGFAFSYWLKINKPEQYEYLVNFLKSKISDK